MVGRLELMYGHEEYFRPAEGDVGSLVDAADAPDVLECTRMLDYQSSNVEGGGTSPDVIQTPSTRLLWPIPGSPLRTEEGPAVALMPRCRLPDVREWLVR